MTPGSCSPPRMSAAMASPAFLPHLPNVPGVDHERVAELASERCVAMQRAPEQGSA